MTVERLSVEMPLAEFMGWRELYRVEDEARAPAAEKSGW